MKKTKVIVNIALFTALTCVLTIFPSFPIAATGGYVHLGDAVIIISVFLIGRHSIASAALGSALADLLLMFVVFAPATFIIKGLMALTAYAVYKVKSNNTSFVLAAIAAEVVMLAGYFIFESFMFGIPAAAASSLMGLTQAAGGIIIGVILYFVLKDTKIKNFLSIK